MSVIFYEGRKAPASLRHLAGFRGTQTDGQGDIGQQVSSIVTAASPWNLLKGIFVDKPQAEAANQAAIAQAQAQEAGIVAQEKADTLRTAMMVGGGVLGVVLLVSLLRRPAPARVAGYRKSRRSRRSRR